LAYLQLCLYYPRLEQMLHCLVAMHLPFCQERIHKADWGCSTIAFSGANQLTDLNMFLHLRKLGHRPPLVRFLST
jgi:hypothetical protein